MKAINITRDNQKKLASQWNVQSEDMDDLLPVGNILIAQFGVTKHFETVSQGLFDLKFNKTGLDLKNDYYEVTFI